MFKQIYPLCMHTGDKGLGEANRIIIIKWRVYYGNGASGILIPAILNHLSNLKLTK